MNKLSSKQREIPSNNPNDGDVFSMMLEAMSVLELNSALEDALENMTEENYDPTLIDAYLNALDRKDPMPEIPDSETSYANLQRRVWQFLPMRGNSPSVPAHKFHRVWRIGLVAALTAICMMGCMVAAQAAGVDVFGAVARWTADIFSLGSIRSDGAKDTPNGTGLEQTSHGTDGEAAYKSLQEALDAYGITEISEPAWVPEGYTFGHVTADCWPNGELISLAGDYSNGTDTLVFEAVCYQDEPRTQVEKNNTPIETFAVNGYDIYLLENTNNNTAAWATDHYECYIVGSVEKNELKQMVVSACANQQ